MVYKIKYKLSGKKRVYSILYEANSGNEAHNKFWHEYFLFTPEVVSVVETQHSKV